MKIQIFFAIAGESLRFAYQNIRANLLRTLLSLMGITIGVFCIIGIFTFVDSIEITVKSSVSSFGDNVILVQKWPWGFSSDYPWWKYDARPETKYREMLILQKKLKTAEAMTFTLNIANNQLKSGSSNVDNIMIRAVSEDYPRVVNMPLQYGRFFSDAEFQTGSPVIVIGYELAKTLFDDPEKALNQNIFTLGRRLKVVGVVGKQGKALGIGGQQDKMGSIPLNFARNLIGTEKSEFGPSIFVKGKAEYTTEKVEDEIRGAMRAVRRLGPRDEDNFALNKITLFTAFLTSLFAQINVFGWFIAGFSILVGGFGIANIMFVSVKERTPIIGIQKSLGAKSYFILIQFLGESVLLCVLGGAIGMFLIFIICQIVSAATDITLVLTFQNIMIGVVISSVIGILSGLVPSIQAAAMDPVEAIRYGA